MGEGAHIGSPTADGGLILTGVPDVLFGGIPASGKGHVTVGQHGVGQVKSGSGTVLVGGVPAARAHDDKHVAPHPSKAGAGVPPVLDAEQVKSLHDALVKALQQIHDKKAQHVKITNDPKGRMPDEVAKEDHGAAGQYGIEIDDWDGDGVPDSVKAEGSLVNIHGEQVAHFGEGGVGIEEDIKLGAGGISGSVTPTQQAASIEASLLKARVGVFAQDPINANNYAKAGFTFGHGEAGAHIAGGPLAGGMAGAEASVVSGTLDANVSRSIFDVANLPGGAALDFLTGGKLTALKDQAFKSLADLARARSPELAKQIESIKDATIEMHGSAGVSGGSAGGAIGARGAYDPKAERYGIDGEGELEVGGGLAVKLGISIGKPIKPPIEKKKEHGEGAHPIVKGELTIIVGK